ncbi:MAG: phage tail protein, partial [Porticoccaceae bacterium]
MSGSKKATVGYKYYLGQHLALCHGPVDNCTRIRFDKRVAWTGVSTGGRIDVSAENLFGGKKREGGVSGAIDLLMGGPSQAQNDYLQAQLGTDIPAFRQVVSMVLRQFYLGMNYYLKAPDFRLQRIHVLQDGAAQWYDAKAPIGVRGPLSNANGWHPYATGWLNVGCAKEISGSLTSYMSWFKGYIDSIRVTKGVSRYSVSSYAVPTAEFDTSGADPYWSNVLFCLLFNGTNGSTTITDAKGHSAAAYNGAALSTAKSKFGGSSCFFDGVDDRVQINFTPGDEDLGDTFTLEAWINLDGFVSVNYGAPMLSAGPPSASYQDAAWSIYGDKQKFLSSGADHGATMAEYTAQFEPLSLGQWYFVSLSRDGATGLYYMHVNGVLATSALSDLNPAHILRECLTNTVWGKGKSATLCPDAVWQPVADTLYSEGMGISILWDQETALADFIGEIERHIEGRLRVNLRTGNYELKLIRNDYTVGSLLVLNAANIDRVEEFNRPGIRDLINSITVNYWDAATGDIATLSVQDIALVQVMGVENHTTIEYPGFTNAAVARRVALRDLRVLATPRAHCTIYANRAAADLNIGDVFKLVWPEYGLSAGTVMRVVTISFGDGQRNQVRITCVEDVFSMPTVGVVAPTPEGWISPSPVATASPTRLPIEAPYYELAQIMGDAAIQNALTTNANAAWFMLAARRSSGAINADLYTDAGGGYLEADTFDFSPNALLNGAVTITQTVWPITSAEDWAEVAIGTHAQVDNEHVRIDAISSTSITVGRGCLDTVPATHASGARIWFWDAYSGNDRTEYVSGEVINAKVLPTTGRGQLAIADAPVDSLTLVGRANLPYPPGNLKVNTVAYPDTISGALALAWAHRNRIQQTTPTIYDTTYGDIGPEPGTTYTLRLYGQAGTLLRTETGLTGTTYSWANEVADSGIIGAGEDPYWNNVVALLHMDGTNGSTTFTDQKGHTFTATGNAQISTAQSKFGGASALFDGTGDLVSSADHADWALGAGD